MEEQPQKFLGRRLSSASDVIDALGGTNSVAEMLDIGASSVSNYRKQGFPARSHFILAKICAERGLDVADAVFGGYQLKAQAKPYQRATTSAPTTALNSGGNTALNRLEQDGFTRLSLPILQPAAPFIDRMGPEMQRRLFTFTDPGGEQLCLRPDLTIPTALAHIASGATGEARYCYQGTAFRYQPRGSGQPEEFTQLGLEIIGGNGGLVDDMEVLSIITTLIKNTGLTDFRVEFDDALFFSLLIEDYSLSKNAIGILKWAFREMKEVEDFKPLALSSLKTKTQMISPPNDSALIAGRAGCEIKRRATEQNLLLNQEAETFIKVVEKLNDLIADMFNSAIPRDEIRNKFPDIKLKQGKHVQDLNDQIFRPFMDSFKPSGLKYTPMLPASMAYYTGLSFRVYTKSMDKPIATGGRYDDLLNSLGAGNALSAVGGAIALERLNRAVGTQ